MALIEAVTSELQDELVQLFRSRRRKPLLRRALHERLARLVDFVVLLLGDRLDERVCLPQRNAAEVMHHLHHLLLIDHDSIGVGGPAFDHFMHLGNLLTTVLARVVVRNKFHRPRTKQRVGRDEILESIRLHSHQQLLHAAGFKLEHAIGIGATKQRQHLLIVQRNAIEIERINGEFAMLHRRRHPNRAANFFGGQRVANHLLGKLNRRERAQPEKVHLQQPSQLASRPIPLGHRILRSTNGAAKRHDLVKRTSGNNHTRRVNALIARVILESLGVIKHTLDARVRQNQLRQRWFLRHRFIERDLEFSRNEVRELLPLRRRESHHSRNILHRRLRLQATEGDDLRHMAVLLSNIVDDRGAPILTDIDVDVGILRTIRIGESLEEQAVLLRTRVGKSEHKARHRPNARATRASRNPALTRPIHEVPNDKKVRADRLVGQNPQLAIETRANLLRHAVVAIAPDEPGLAKILERDIAVGLEISGSFDVLGRIEGQRLEQSAIGLEPLGQISIDSRRVLRTKTRMLDLHHRRVIFLGRKRHIASLGNPASVAHRLGRLRKHRKHFLGALHIQRLWILQSRRIVFRLLHGNAAQRVVDVVIFGAEKVRIVVGDQRNTQLVRQLTQIRIDLLLLGDMPLQLDEKSWFALFVGLEVRRVPLGFRDGARPHHRILTRLDEVLEVRRQRRTEVTIDRNDAVRPLRERRLVHARLVVKAVEKRVRRKLEQIAVTLDVLSEQHQMPTAVLLASVGLVTTIADLAFTVDGNIALDAEDRLHANVPRLQVELHRAEHVAVVGDGDGVHAELLHPLEQALNAISAVKQRVLRVQMEMCEHRRVARGRRGGFRHLSSTSHRLGKGWQTPHRTESARGVRAPKPRRIHGCGS